MNKYKVTLCPRSGSGKTTGNLHVTVEASSIQDARRTLESLYPDYRASDIQRID